MWEAVHQFHLGVCAWTFPHVQPRWQITHIKAHVCLCTFPCACHSICLPVCLPVWWLLCSLSLSWPCLPVCLSAGLLGQSKVALLHASCGNHNMYAQHARAAETGQMFQTPCFHKRSYGNVWTKEDWERKFFFLQLGMYDSPLRVWLLSPSNCPFSVSPHPFLLLSFRAKSPDGTQGPTSSKWHKYSQYKRLVQVNHGELTHRNGTLSL